LFLKNKLFLFFLIFSVGIIFSGCGLFNDIDLGEEPDLSDQAKAEFLNTFINDLETLVQEFIEETYYEEPAVTVLLDDPYHYLNFPDPEDLDLSQLLAHFDLFIIPNYYNDWVLRSGAPYLADEEEFSKYIVDVLEEFLKDLLGANEIDQEDFNETDILVHFTYKYFYDRPVFRVGQNDYPQEEMQFVELIFTQKTTVNGNETEKFQEGYASLAEYEADFKLIEIDFWDLLGVGPVNFR